MTYDGTERGGERGATTGTSRRDVLRKTAAATAAGLAAGAFAGTATAEHATPVDVGGVGEAAVVTSLETTGGDVLAALAADGLLADASAAALPTADRVDLGEVAANREGTATVRGGDGVLRHVTVARLDDGVLTVTVEPERDRSYAHFRPDGGDARYLYDPEAGLGGVEREVSPDSCTCHPLTCSDGSPVEECTYCECGTICGSDGCCCNTTYGCC